MTERSPSPLSAERERVISACAEKARAYLESHRIQIDDGFIGASKHPHGTRDKKYKKFEIENDRAEVQRLETVFEFNRMRASEDERSKHDGDKKISDIFEAMFADIAKQIFGDSVEVIVPSHFDDYKRQTDLVVVFKDSTGKPEAAIVVDFTTQQDIDGYTDEDGHRGGLEVKWAHSLKDIASKGQRFHSVKYAKVNGVRQEINNAPRILVGLSTDEILRLAPQWQANSLNIQSDVRVRELAESIQRQLIVQMRLAKKNNRDRAYKHICSVVEIAKKRTKKVPDDAPRATSKDPVIEKINSMLAFSTRDTQYGKAKELQESFDATPSRAEWSKDLKEPLSEMERVHLEKHLRKVEPTGEVLRQLDLFIEGKAHTLNRQSLLILAGGVPTRVWRRLHVLRTVEPTRTDETKKDEKKSAHTESAHTEHTESTSSVLDAASHLALLKKASGITEEKYAKLDTRGKRIWSFIKEKGIRALVSGVGAAIGSTFALALCAGALPSMLIALGGAVAGSLLGNYLLKKYYYDKHPDKDHTKDRARAATIQSLSRWAQKNPYTFAQYYGGPHGEAALKKAIERKVFLRNLAGNALAVGVGTVAGLEVRTGGQFTKTLLTGDFDRLWQLFYCPPSARSGPRWVADTPRQFLDGRPYGALPSDMQYTPRNSLGRGMPAQGAMYTFEAPRARLPAWLHQQCIGQCNSTAPWGYHTWNPGRVNASGQQLYALRYTPR